MRGRFNGRVVGQDYTGRNTRHNGRAGMYNAVQSALAPSLDITLANGLGPLFTYTRATTATVTDFEGLVKNCLSGELRIQGARRVCNLTRYSQDLSNVAWSTSNGVIAANNTTAPDGTTTADKLTASAGTVRVSCSSTVTGSAVVGETVILSFHVKAGTYHYLWMGDRGDSVIRSATFNLSTGAVIGSSNITSSAIELDEEGFYRCSIVFNRTLAGSVSLNIALGDSIHSTDWPTLTFAGTESLYPWGGQSEYVTGQSVKTVGEYLSTDVLQSPFHGYFADGVKYFSYDLNGAAITGTIGYLAEGARTNSCLQSNGFGTTWSASAVSVSSGQTTAPDGTLTGWKLIEDNTNAPHYIRQSITQTAAGWTVSIRAKAGSASRYLGIFNGGAGSGGGGANACVAFDIINGTVGQVGSEWTSASITPLPGGWYLCTATATMQAGAAYLDIRIGNAATTAAVNSGYSGDGSSFIYIAWASDEAGAFASSYIPTTTAAVARNADVLTFASAGILPASGQPETWWAEVSRGASVSDAGVILGGNQNFRALVLQSMTAGAKGYSYHDAAATGPAYTASGLSADTLTELAFVFNGAAVTAYKNGVAGTAVSMGAQAADATTVAIGCDTSGANNFFGIISKVKVLKSALSASQVAAL